MPWNISTIARFRAFVVIITSVLNVVVLFFIVSRITEIPFVYVCSLYFSQFLLNHINTQSLIFAASYDNGNIPHCSRSLSYFKKYLCLWVTVRFTVLYVVVVVAVIVRYPKWPAHEIVLNNIFMYNINKTA